MCIYIYIYICIYTYIHASIFIYAHVYARSALQEAGGDVRKFAVTMAEALAGQAAEAIHCVILYHCMI